MNFKKILFIVLFLSGCLVEVPNPRCREEYVCVPDPYGPYICEDYWGPYYCDCYWDLYCRP